MPALPPCGEWSAWTGTQPPLHPTVQVDFLHPSVQVYLLVAGQVQVIFSLSEHPAVSGKGTKRGWLWPTNVAEDNLGLLEDLISEIGNNEDLLEVVVVV